VWLAVFCLIAAAALAAGAALLAPSGWHM
jgi:hypothetical protein